MRFIICFLPKPIFECIIYQNLWRRGGGNTAFTFYSCGNFYFFIFLHMAGFHKDRAQASPYIPHIPVWLLTSDNTFSGMG